MTVLPFLKVTDEFKKNDEWLAGALQSVDKQELIRMIITRDSALRKILGMIRAGVDHEKFRFHTYLLSANALAGVWSFDPMEGIKAE